MMEVLTANLRELITDQRHFLARAEKILDYIEKNNISTDTSAKTDPKPDHFNVEELHELERAVREAALYLLNVVNKKSPPSGQLERKAKNPSKLLSRVQSTKKEKNLDTNDSTSSQPSLRSNALSDSELPVPDGHDNSAVVAPQKKTAKKRGKAKNQRKQGTNESTTSNSNTYAKDVFNGNIMDIILASLPKSNQSPRFENSSDNSGPNSIPPWFWYLYSLILVNILNRSTAPYLQINYTDKSKSNYTESRAFTRVKGKGNKTWSTSTCNVDRSRNQTLLRSKRVNVAGVEVDSDSNVDFD